jgi:hypothetical protein
LLQEAIATSGRSGVPAHQNKVHRMRSALDNVCNALRDVY